MNPLPGHIPALQQRVRRLFDEVIEKPESQRLPFLRAACTDDVEAYQAVVRLLDARSKDPTFLEHEAGGMIHRIGRYLVTGELGRGAMGVVYEAIDPLIGRNVAIKIIHKAIDDPGEAEFMRDRLFREARAAGRLFHPGIVVIFDVGQDNDVAYIAMERVDGPPLERLLASGQRLRLPDALDILQQTATALDYAHQNGIVHRDIKPGNIMLHHGGVVKVSDFGIAKSMSTQYGTIAGLVVGTPSYMSPEQIEALPIDGRSDQFSLAVLAYELLSGSRPFKGDSLAMLAHTIVDGDRPSIRATDPDLPLGLDEVLHRGLARKPEQRYKSCAEFVGALEEKLRQVPDIKSVREGQFASSREETSVNSDRDARKPRGGLIQFLLAVSAAIVVLVSVLFFFRSTFLYRYVPLAPRPIAKVQAIPPLLEAPTAPAVTRFVLDPESIRAGSSATLRWDVAGATEILIDQGIGKVTGNGKANVSPRIATVYALTAIGPGGSVSAHVRLEVTSPLADKQTQARRLYIAAVEKRRTAEYKDAVELFRQAADLGEPSAMQNLGEMYMEGNGIAKDDEEAVRWFRKGADKGDTSSMLFLGGMYLLGTGVAQSYTDAVEWFRKAADGENPAAIFDLGTLYETGRGVAKDLVMAKGLYEKAARLGNEEAQKRLARSH